MPYRDETSFLTVKMRFIREWKEGRDPDIRQYLLFYPQHAAQMIAFALEFAALESARAATAMPTSLSRLALTEVSPAAPLHPATATAPGI